MATRSRNGTAALVARALLLAAAAGCTGTVGAGAGGSSGAAASSGGPSGAAGGTQTGVTGAAGATSDACSTTASLAPARIWRITDAEYVNAVAQLFGVRVPSEVTEADAASPDFTDFSEAPELTVQANTVTAYQLAAHNAATTAVAANLGVFLPCGKTAPTDACVTGFIRNRVGRAFGRPLTDTDVSDLLAIYHTGLAQSVSDGIRLVIEATLQSPSFLYRTELGPAMAGGPAAKVKLTSFELAAAVSYALLDSVPDDELWARAEDGTLTTPSVLAKEVDRVLALPAAQANLAHQAGYWLGVEKLQSIVPKNTTLFPAWTSSVESDLYASARLFVQELMGTGTMTDLMSSSRMYLNANLATVYGVPGVTGTDLVPVDVAVPGRNLGIFSQPAILAAWSHPDRGDAVHRGLFIYNAFVCGPTIPPPPANAATVAAGFPADASQRELVMLRATNAAGCGTCHGLFDPLGLSTENYDPIGRYATVDSTGQPIDASATLKGLGPDLDGDVKSVADVVTKLKSGRRASDCASKNMAAIVLGRSVTDDNSCAYGAIKDSFAQSGSFAGYFRAMLTSPGFLTRDAAP